MEKWLEYKNGIIPYTDYIHINSNDVTVKVLSLREDRSISAYAEGQKLSDIVEHIRFFKSKFVREIEI